MWNGYHFKSWSGVNKELEKLLADSLKGRISYFLTKYQSTHNCWGRAAIRLDGRELAIFSWVEQYEQESTCGYKGTTDAFDEDPQVVEQWKQNATFSDGDFLYAATRFLQMNIGDALICSDFLVRIFAILDQRVGKRTLRKIRDAGEYREYPDWVRQFYELRFTESAIE